MEDALLVQEETMIRNLTLERWFLAVPESLPSYDAVSDGRSLLSGAWSPMLRVVPSRLQVCSQSRVLMS